MPSSSMSAHATLVFVRSSCKQYTNVPQTAPGGVTLLAAMSLLRVQPIGACDCSCSIRRTQRESQIARKTKRTWDSHQRRAPQCPCK